MSDSGRFNVDLKLVTFYMGYLTVGISLHSLIVTYTSLNLAVPVYYFYLTLIGLILMVIAENL